MWRITHCHYSRTHAVLHQPRGDGLEAGRLGRLGRDPEFGCRRPSHGGRQRHSHHQRTCGGRSQHHRPGRSAARYDRPDCRESAAGNRDQLRRHAGLRLQCLQLIESRCSHVASRLAESITLSLSQALTIRLSTSSRSSLLGLKKGILFGGTSTRAPVFGFRPLRARLWRVWKLPNPRISTLSPARRARTMPSNIAQTTTSDSFRGISVA
jgi:hypothetical protein